MNSSFRVDDWRWRSVVFPAVLIKHTGVTLSDETSGCARSFLVGAAVAVVAAARGVALVDDAADAVLFVNALPHNELQFTQQDTQRCTERNGMARKTDRSIE